MATTPDEYLVIFHVDDGEQWANFLSSRLIGPNYNIKSVVKNLTSTTSVSWNAKIYGSSTGSNESSINERELRDSGRGSRTINDLTFDTQCIENAKARIVLLSPDILNFEPFPFDVTLLNPKRSVFLLLGLEIEDVRSYFRELSDHVFKCRCCVIHSDEKYINDAMVEIIEAYEDHGGSNIGDDEDVYANPPSPRQLNRIEKVIPREVTGKDRDAHFLLERPAEDDLVIVSDNFPEELPVTCVCDRFYKFTLPDNVYGEIFFKVICRHYCLGEDSILVLSKLDQIQAIVNEEVNPLAVIASAMKLTSRDLDSIDSALASKLQQLSSVATFLEMFPCEDALNNSLTDERADVMYPTLLHFAADWNLRKFCSQLLRYPGMLAAAMTENKDGDDPSTLAFKKGYIQLEADLIQFVDDHSRKQFMEDGRTSASDYILPSEAVQHSSGPPPKPHTPGKVPGYVNLPPSTKKDSGLYIQMANFKDIKHPDLGRESQRSDTDIVSPVSQASDNVFTRCPSFRDDIDDIDQEISNMGWSSDHSSHSASGATAKKALKMLGVNEEEIKRSKPSTSNRVYARSEFPVTKPLMGNIPHGVRYPGVSRMAYDPDRASQSSGSNCEDSVSSGVNQHDSKQKVNKFVAFFGKIKNKRSASEGENIYIPAHAVKKTQSTRSDKLKKKSPESNVQERDSGSYSDEENGKEGSNGSAGRKNSKPREFKERDKPMTRRRPMSRRAQIASQEHVEDAPKVPSTRRSRGGFRSFIEIS